MPGFLDSNQMMIKSIKHSCLISFWISLFLMMHLNIPYACGSEYYLTPAPCLWVVDEDIDLLWLLTVVLQLQLAAPILLHLHCSSLLTMSPWSQAWASACWFWCIGWWFLVDYFWIVDWHDQIEIGWSWLALELVEWKWMCAGCASSPSW